MGNRDQHDENLGTRSSQNNQSKQGSQGNRGNRGNQADGMKGSPSQPVSPSSRDVGSTRGGRDSISSDSRMGDSSSNASGYSARNSTKADRLGPDSSDDAPSDG